MVALPIADKLALRMQEEARNCSLVMGAVLGIQNGQNPRVPDVALKTYLHESKRQPETTAE